MNELIFEVMQEADGGFVAEALGESIFTQADSWDELRGRVREAVTAFYFDRPAPARVRYWRMLGSLKWAVMCLMMFDTHASGADPSLERAVIGRRVSECEVDLLALMEQAA